ncbi:hypothetical protein Thein_0501 [Thermodesulfatator indicus DSM 15286]|uniref:Formylmethanofuran dehydrogenase subunit E domain-containing protein n=1 Tax=Thermodesulfatator indicus (strain DSM 15286 / JCM 11887 / CIR29812) TaxID=667014 RepID=F8AB17_THEID|nr:formylmethanofuran dehydrogenase subunit E family protein [Thermodesulfatator indicus]AEH44383.1 hypothetical protein Thein_0501 [Thermodesulfatator indicus DSM 15286]
MLLVDLELKVIAEKHGHLCPYLALGWRVGLFFKNFLLKKEFTSFENFFVLAYAHSCALSALELMNFKISCENIGEHVYVLQTITGDALSMIAVNAEIIIPPRELEELTWKIKSDTALYYEKAHYSYLFDNWIVDILNASEEELFVFPHERV